MNWAQKSDVRIRKVRAAKTGNLIDPFRRIDHHPQRGDCKKVIGIMQIQGRDDYETESGH
jgi:hypothetical protein